MGSGVSGAAGSTAGAWDFLIGPDYTSPNFIKNEVLSLIVDGKEQDLALKMHRGRKSGVFWGGQQIGDLSVYLIDFTNNDSIWVGRGIRFVQRWCRRTHDTSQGSHRSGPGFQFDR